MTSDAPDAKVVVPLTPDDVGWPPMATEHLWAWSLGDDRYRIASPPWFARDLAVDDVVRARVSGIPADAGPDATAAPTFIEVLVSSQNVTLRLIVHPPLSLENASKAIAPLGVGAEGFAHYSMLAVDVPPEADFAAVAHAMDEGQRAGRWDWEEAKITARWIAATAGI